MHRSDGSAGHGWEGRHGGDVLEHGCGTGVGQTGKRRGEGVACKGDARERMRILTEAAARMSGERDLGRAARPSDQASPTNAI